MPNHIELTWFSPVLAIFMPKFDHKVRLYCCARTFFHYCARRLLGEPHSKYFWFHEVFPLSKRNKWICGNNRKSPVNFTEDRTKFVHFFLSTVVPFSLWTFFNFSWSLVFPWFQLCSKAFKMAYSIWASQFKVRHGFFMLISLRL